MSTQRGTIRLGLACNNRCIFCAQDGLSATDPTATEVNAALEALRRQSSEVSFVGGEPTEYPGLERAVVQARQLGFTGIGIQTNGRALAVRHRVDSLEHAGLTDVHFSLHGATADPHDYHTGVRGSFAEALAGLNAVQGRTLTIAVATLLTRSNFRSLSALPELLAAHGVSAWMIAVPRVVGRAARAFDRIVPRLAMAMPFALHAIERAHALGLVAVLHGAPMCLVGPFARFTLPDDARSFATACTSCPARRECAGVDAPYLEHFGDAELSVRRVSATTTGPLPALARLFVGIGETASIRPPEREPSTAALIPAQRLVRG